MARPKKTSLDYFPFDVDFFEDEKLFDVQNEYGPLGEVIYLRLLCLVYKHGYYYEFGSMDRLAGILIRSIGNRWTRNKQTVKDVISLLAENNLFSPELMRRNILTSRGIQLRYLKALERNQPEINEYCLVEKSGSGEALLSAPSNSISDTDTGVFAAETLDNVSKNNTKESKENKKKLYKSKTDAAADFSRVSLTDEERSELERLADRLTVEKYINSIIQWQEANRKLNKKPYAYIKKWIEEDGVKKQAQADGGISAAEYQAYAESIDFSKIDV